MIQALLDLQKPSLRPLILAKLSRFGAAGVPKELQPEH